MGIEWRLANLSAIAVVALVVAILFVVIFIFTLRTIVGIVTS